MSCFPTFDALVEHEEAKKNEAFTSHDIKQAGEKLDQLLHDYESLRLKDSALSFYTTSIHKSNLSRVTRINSKICIEFIDTPHNRKSVAVTVQQFFPDDREVKHFLGSFNLSKGELPPTILLANQDYAFVTLEGETFQIAKTTKIINPEIADSLMRRSVCDYIFDGTNLVSVRKSKEYKIKKGWKKSLGYPFAYKVKGRLIALKSLIDLNFGDFILAKGTLVVVYVENAEKLDLPMTVLGFDDGIEIILENATERFTIAVGPWDMLDVDLNGIIGE